MPLPQREQFLQRRHVLALAFAMTLTAALVAVLVATALKGRAKARLHEAHLQAKLAGLQLARASERIDCDRFRSERPLVLLILGQSNAGNHGEPATDVGEAIRVMDAGKCSISTDPLPGATGSGGSAWSLLPKKLVAMGIEQPIVLQILAVDGSSMADWVRSDSVLHQRLRHLLAQNAVAGLKPDLVLLQHGEADAKSGTPPQRYVEQLAVLAHTLERSDVRVPIMLALSTRCRSMPSVAYHQALRALAGQDKRFVIGPDTDTDTDVQLDRTGGCHWSLSGRDRVAALWSTAISAQRTRPTTKALM